MGRLTTRGERNTVQSKAGKASNSSQPSPGTGQQQTGENILPQEQSSIWVRLGFGLSVIAFICPPFGFIFTATCVNHAENARRKMGLRTLAASCFGMAFYAILKALLQGHV